MDPGVAMDDANTVAVICVALTNWLLNGDPLANTVDPESKFAPVTVRVNVAKPAWANDGLNVVMLSPPKIGSETAFDVRWLASRTVMLSDPGVVISDAGTVAVICVALAKTEVNEVDPAKTVMPVAKPLPFTVKVNVLPPALANEGLSDVIEI